ncbi:hypothetical protein ERJ75_001811800 [Trypanosoma vivax]|nr:hypothetical protein ERJ75_001811800 [Trypanosoma vivax]
MKWDGQGMRKWSFASTQSTAVAWLLLSVLATVGIAVQINDCTGWQDHYKVPAQGCPSIGMIWQWFNATKAVANGARMVKTQIDTLRQEEETLTLKAEKATKRRRLVLIGVDPSVQQLAAKKWKEILEMHTHPLTQRHKEDWVRTLLDAEQGLNRTHTALKYAWYSIMTACQTFEKAKWAEIHRGG